MDDGSVAFGFLLRSLTNVGDTLSNDLDQPGRFPIAGSERVARARWFALAGPAPRWGKRLSYTSAGPQGSSEHH